MLVSHSHKFIYMKVGKTASSSIQSYFEQYCQDGIIGLSSNKEWLDMMPALTVKEKVGDDVWNSYYKFCSIRDPYDKAISAFYWMKHEANLPIYHIEDERKEFEEYILHRVVVSPHRDFKSYIIDDSFCLDDVIRYETLSADMLRVCNILDIPWNPDIFPNLKTGIRPANISISDLYTADTIEVIATTFAFDIEYFNYKYKLS